MYAWLGMALVLVIAEVLTTNMVFASFAIGAVAAGIIAAITDSLLAQVLSFGIMSVLSLTAVRPTILKHLYRNTETHVSGLNRLVGRVAITTSVVNSTSGEIFLNGETWSARTTGTAIQAQTQVVVVSISGAIAIVESQSKD